MLMADMSGQKPIRISELFPDASAIIRKYESVNQSGKPHLIPYYDIPGDRWTVGLGRTIMSEKQRKKLGLTKDELKEKYAMTAEETEIDFDNQIRSAMDDVRKLQNELPEGVEFTKDEIEGLLPIAQNVGYTKLKDQGINAFKSLRKGDKESFGYHLFNPKDGFIKSGGNKLKGLVERRATENSIYSRNKGGMVMRNYYDYEPRSI
tara:strand:- start:109 stop:726 length:618 start_codon:yes stop_codon:yes gene_type:complete